MDWPLAITKNRAALAGIVATLFAYAGLSADVAPATLPRPLRNAILRLLRPAESAVRRLIVIAARRVTVSLGRQTTPLWPPERKLKGGHLPRKGADRQNGLVRLSTNHGDLRARYGSPISPLAGEMAGRPEGGSMAPRAPAFPLFDRRKHFAWAKPKTVPGFGPRISAFGFVDPVFPPPRDPDAPVPAARLCRRLQSLKAALDDLPRQARRLARRQARKVRPTFSPRGRRWPEGPDEGASNGGGAFHRSPLRPGRPPGHRHRRAHAVDDILAECHGLARLALDAPDMS